MSFMDDDASQYLTPGGSAKIVNQSNQGLQDDGVWIITASFTIFTMTSGFGLLESGRVSSKDEVNIMVKNVIDVIFGGLSYWMFGFGFTFGQSAIFENSFIGIGDFFFDPILSDENTEGWTYASFIYQMSFATTTSAIVSGEVSLFSNISAKISSLGFYEWKDEMQMYKSLK
ncbi:hypothetical protein OESDEN_09990 [Oesophagostomum dentatum]|uniref:Ammonium transporter AmtB-like domain-containing protein n=1 Tax=Oesophagostomum dentatum TaxID=61180 RepID=A0A0B1T227_OESDE|nr:hypothetical protein OESDEN_09990 [Oesophagostomum dentatum]